MQKHIIHCFLFVIFCIISYFLSSIVLSQIRLRHEQSLLLTRNEELVQEERQKELKISNILQEYSIPESIQKTLLQAPNIVTFTMITSLYLAYRNHIEELYWDDEIRDFVITINGRKIALANGRLIFVERLARDLLNYIPVMYLYPLQPIDKIYDTIAAVDETIHEKSRSTDLQLALSSKEDGDTEFIHLYFLGTKLKIHSLIKETLHQIEEEVRILAEQDEEVKTFLSSLLSISSYSNRKIKKSNNASLHSFGIAIDFLHKNYNYKLVYWQWARVVHPNKWRKPALDDLWLIPSKLVTLFEKHGFVWGGKWSSYDTLHFEYKPEIIEYAKLRQRLQD